MGRKQKKREKKQIEMERIHKEHVEAKKTELQKEAEAKQSMGPIVLDEHAQTTDLAEVAMQINEKHKKQSQKVQNAKSQKISEPAKETGMGKILSFSLISLLLVVVCIFGLLNSEKDKVIKEQEEMIALLNTQIQTEKTNLMTLEGQIAEQAQTITLLSESVTAKNEEIARLQEADRIMRTPTNYPLKGTAAISNYEDAETEEEETPEEPEDALRVLFVAAKDTCVLATAMGTVESIETDETYGFCIQIDHGNGYRTIYKGNGFIYVEVGDLVSSGCVLMRTTDDSTSISYQIMYNESFIDPLECMEING